MKTVTGSCYIFVITPIFLMTRKISVVVSHFQKKNLIMFKSPGTIIPILVIIPIYPDPKKKKKKKRKRKHDFVRFILPNCETQIPV